MVWEYLSLGINQGVQNKRRNLGITVNGFTVKFYSTKPHADFGWSPWENTLDLKETREKIVLNEKKLLDLVNVVMLPVRREDGVITDFLYNADLAIIANFFAKDGWKLGNNGDHKGYLLFEREI